MGIKMRKIVYCKYNMNRSPLFQTKTAIIDDDGERFIEKSPVSEEGLNHILRFEDDYINTQKIYPNLTMLKPKIKETAVEYPFINGVPIEERYLNGVNSVEKLIEGIKDIIEKYLVPSEDCVTGFEMSEKFKKCFGEVDCSSDVCLCPCNIDMIFDNIILVDDKPVVFDYEWVFEIPIPKDYVLYRILCHIYDKRFDEISESYSISDFISEFGINEEAQTRYRTMEDHFMEYVFGNGNLAFSGNTYLHERKKITDFDFYKNGYNETLDMLHSTEDKYREEIDNHQKTIAEYKKAIKEYEKVVEQLHKTEEELVDNIKKYTDTVELYKRTSNELQSTTDALNTTKNDLDITQADLRNEIESNRIHLEMIKMKDEYISGLEGQLNLMANSVSWKVTKPLRGVKRVVKGKKKVATEAIAEDVVQGIDKTSVENDELESVEGVEETVKEAFTLKKYLAKQYEEIKEKNVGAIETVHKISLITPLFNTPEKYLIDLLESVVSQSIDSWELCLVNYSDDDHKYVNEICNDYKSRYNNIIYVEHSENKGISDNSNECASYASGDYIGVLDHDDVLHKYAIEEMIRKIEETGSDFVYSDEAKFEEEIEDANYINIKPDFSVDELRAHNFICHFNVFKKELFDLVGGYRKEYDGSQDHDLVLRLTEKASKIEHIPEVLYFWRVHSGSVAKNIEAKPYATKSGEAAVTEQLRRLGNNQYAESVINNIPLYRIHTDEEIEVDCSIVIWGHKDSQEYNAAIAKITNTGDAEIINADDYNSSFNEIIKNTKNRYVFWVRAGLGFDLSELKKTIGLYKNRNDISSFDFKIMSQNNDIVSGGAYILKDDEHPIRVRCMGGGSDYYGYENALLYVRQVICSLGYCTVIDKSDYDDSINVMDKGISEVLIKYTLNRDENGKKNLFVPYYEISGATDVIKSELIDTLLKIDCSSKRDPYFNTDIIDLCLE